MLFYFLLLPLTAHPPPDVLEFRRIQEVWVVEEHYRPTPAINSLGARRYKDRQQAYLTLRLRGMNAFNEVAAAAELHRDPEVRDQATKLLGVFYKCHCCDHDDKYCSECCSSCDLRLKATYDENGIPIYTPRELFPRKFQGW